MKEQDWENYDEQISINMKHGFDLYLKPLCEYSKKRYIYQIAEANEIDFLLKNYLFTDSTCIDIGANIGYWTKLLLTQFKTKEVHSFEPFDATFQVLKKNVINNKNSYVNNIAISDHDGFINLYINESHTGDNRPTYSPERNKIEVLSQTLDNYLYNSKVINISFIKIDIQGGEIAALEGMQQTVKTYNPLILIEVDPELDKDINAYIINFLFINNYNAFTVLNGKRLYQNNKSLITFSGNLFMEHVS
jgi:FkbM family methyltransferase